MRQRDGNSGEVAQLEYYWQTPADLPHYARACVDILCEFPFGTEELEGIAARGDFDLSAHQTEHQVAGDLRRRTQNRRRQLTDEQKEALIQKRLAAEAAKTKGEPMPEAAVRAWFERLFKGSYVPHVIEPSAGLDRMALAVIAKAFSERAGPPALVLGRLVVGDGTQADVRHDPAHMLALAVFLFPVNEAAGRTAGRLLQLEVLERGREQALTSHGQRHPRGVGRDPTPAPVLSDVGGGA